MSGSTWDVAAPTGIQRWVPGVRMLHTYQRTWLTRDLIAGVVLAAILIPQGMAYAELAGLPAVTGLYTTIACLVGYALMGPSRVLVLGPDSSVSPLIFAAVVPLAANGGPDVTIALASMLALLVGAIEIGLGIARLGFVADLLSQEVQIGYMNGLAITIVVGQLPKLFGFSTEAEGFIDELRAFVHGLDKTNGTTLVLGLATLAVPCSFRSRRSGSPPCWWPWSAPPSRWASSTSPRTASPSSARCRRVCPRRRSPRPR